MANNTTKKAGSNKSFIDRMGGQKFIVLLVVIALFIFFCAMSPNFRKYTTFINILDFSYYIVLMAIGVAFPLMTGGVDLSIGTGLVCYSLVGGYLIVHKGMPTIVGILAAIILGMLIGVLNGVLVAIMDLPAFLATLCTCMITRGLGSIIVGGFGISWPAAAAPGGWFRSIFKIQSGGQNIPIGFLWVILLVVVMTFVLNHTRIGRYTLAIGSNKEATRLSGVNVKKWEMLAYIICGTLVGIASIFFVATYTTVQPGYGDQYNNEAIAGCVMGGTSMAGGLASISGTVIGVVIISLLQQGILALGFTKEYQYIITGLIVIAAVYADVSARRRKN